MSLLDDVARWTYEIMGLLEPSSPTNKNTDEKTLENLTTFETMYKAWIEQQIVDAVKGNSTELPSQTEQQLQNDFNDPPDPTNFPANWMNYQWNQGADPLSAFKTSDIYTRSKNGTKDLITPTVRSLGHEYMLIDEITTLKVPDHPDADTLPRTIEIDASQNALTVTLPKTNQLRPHVITWARTDSSGYTVNIDKPDGTTLKSLASGDIKQTFAGENGWV